MREEYTENACPSWKKAERMKMNFDDKEGLKLHGA